MENQRKMLEHQLGHIESFVSLIQDLDEDIKQKTEYISWATEDLDAMTGIGRERAERILA